MTMKAMVEDVRRWTSAWLAWGAASLHGVWASLPSGDGRAGHDDDRRRGPGCATLVAMVQTAALWEGDNVAGRGSCTDLGSA